MKLSRKAIQEGIKTVPIEHILGADVSRQLTAKQRKFAHEVAKGSTKADAYRAAYNVTSNASTRNDPYRIASDPRIVREIEAYTLALEAAKHRTPAALRELVIQGLVQVALNPDAKDAVKVQALKTIGTITEVAAFTERKEVRTISSSEDARAKVMQELRTLISNGAEDATILEADSLLRELTGDNIMGDAANNIMGADNIMGDAADNIMGDAQQGTTNPPSADPPTGEPPNT